MLKTPLDIITACGNNGWTDSFLWPHSQIKNHEIRHAVESSFFDFYSCRSETEKKLLRLLFNFLVKEHLVLINIFLVINGFKERGILPDASMQDDWNGISKGILLNGIPYQSAFKIPVFDKYSIKQKIKKFYQIRRRQLYSTIYGHTINKKSLILSPSGLLGELPKEDIKRKNFVLFDDIFNKKKASNHNFHELCKGLLQNSINLYNSFSIDLSPKLLTYLTSMHLYWAKMTEHYLLMAREYLLDKNYNKILVVSGHNYFNRVIIETANDLCIQTIAHEHGEPKSYYDTTINNYGELALSNDFVTYSNASVKIYSKNTRKYKKINENKIRFSISQIGVGEFHRKLLLKTNKIKESSKNIIYVAGSYVNDAFFMGNRPHDIVYYEWQIWLISTLLNLKYDVKIKLHPEGLLSRYPIRLPFDVEHLKGNFTKYIDYNCTYIFDTTYSSALNLAICTKNPIILINDQLNELDREVREDIENRVTIVNAFYDNRNRMRVAKEELQNALNLCSHNKDTGFAWKYLLS